MSKKPLISEQEWVKLCVREDNRIPREMVPHCFGMPILSLPECNHLVGKSQNVCQIRHSCALAYAERLKLDVSKAYSGDDKEAGYPALVVMVKDEERRIKFVPELGRRVEAQAQETAPQDVVEEEVTMAAAVPEAMAVETPAAQPKPPRPAKKPAVAQPKTGAPSMRATILGILRDSPEWMSKADIVGALEKHLNRSPLNLAALHKVSMVLLPKSQEKFGYKIDKRVIKNDGKAALHVYKLING